jgi:hypothetical protein
MRLISAGSLVRIQSGPVFIDARVFVAAILPFWVAHSACPPCAGLECWLRRPRRNELFGLFCVLWFGERRLPACSCRQLADNRPCKRHFESCYAAWSQQAAETCRLAACAPHQTENLSHISDEHRARNTSNSKVRCGETTPATLRVAMRAGRDHQPR